METLFSGVRAPSTLGSHLRSYAWGNVRQLDKAHRGFLAALADDSAAAARTRGPRIHRYRLDAEAGLRLRQGGRGVRAREDRGEEPAGQGPEPADLGDQHPAGRPGPGPGPAARRERRLGPRRRRAGRRGDRHRPRSRLHRDDPRPDGLRVLQRRRDRDDPPQRGVFLRHRADELQHPGRDRGDPRATGGRRSGTRRPSGTTSWTAGSPTPRSRRSSTRRSRRRRKASRSPPG